MAEQIEVRPFEDGDLEQVLEVLRLSLGEPAGLRRTNELFAWKHFENPFGRSLLLVAAADGRIAGFRAFMRWRLQGPAGDTLNCVRAVDTATHPAFQRRGVFRLLTLAGIDEATAEGVDLIFNTPNEKSGAGYLTMGWKEIGQVGLDGTAQSSASRVAPEPSLGAPPLICWFPEPRRTCSKGPRTTLIARLAVGGRHGRRSTCVGVSVPIRRRNTYFKRANMAAASPERISAGAGESWLFLSWAEAVGQLAHCNGKPAPTTRSPGSPPGRLRGAWRFAPDFCRFQANIPSL